MKEIFITGGTGYIGRRLIKRLLDKGHHVKALVRAGSEKKLPPGCGFVAANAFEPLDFNGSIPEGCTFIQLLGVPHPGPSKKEQFRKIDLASAKASVMAAQMAGVGHFIYISVAQTPSGIMQAYQSCRAEAEAAISATGIPATFIRPWYVIGPGHYWPLLIQPLLTLLELFPATSVKAKAFRVVYLKQLLNMLIHAVENTPAQGVRICEIDEIRKHG